MGEHVTCNYVIVEVTAVTDSHSESSAISVHTLFHSHRVSAEHCTALSVSSTVHLHTLHGRSSQHKARATPAQYHLAGPYARATASTSRDIRSSRATRGVGGGGGLLHLIELHKLLGHLPLHFTRVRVVVPLAPVVLDILLPPAAGHVAKQFSSQSYDTAEPAMG